MAGFQKRRSTGVVVLALGAAACCAPAFLAPASRASAPEQAQQTLAIGGAALVASLPAPAYAGGMFDFGLTLPFVAGTFLLMMVVLNALWYGPVTEEVDERNAKLLKTLSEATDRLAKADEIQVQYTAQIREAREKASAELATARQRLEESVNAELSVAAEKRDAKAAEIRAKLDQEVQSKIASAEGEIESRKAEFVKATLAGAGF
eukprot:gb/GFBE01052031.1/.p1 GENE.gb/GFBE01052031.1/~~gb/GFBE01052031.1/.p1  ORF type:complete len:206 (+),score=52.30 gb/GFBE01052031.1/:1-618(+)